MTMFLVYFDVTVTNISSIWEYITTFPKQFLWQTQETLLAGFLHANLMSFVVKLKSISLSGFVIELLTFTAASPLTCDVILFRHQWMSQWSMSKWGNMCRPRKWLQLYMQWWLYWYNVWNRQVFWLRIIVIL